MAGNGRGRGTFGGNTWYVPGAHRLIEEQGRDGFWTGNYNEPVQTAFKRQMIKAVPNASIEDAKTWNAAETAHFKIIEG